MKKKYARIFLICLFLVPGSLFAKTYDIQAQKDMSFIDIAAPSPLSGERQFLLYKGQNSVDTALIKDVKDKEIDFKKEDLVDVVKDIEVKDLDNKDGEGLDVTLESLVNTEKSVGPEKEKKASKPKTDNATGAMNYDYAIDLPSGRSGLTPEFSLRYNSQNSDEGSIYGYGWSSSIPYIVRENKQGTDQLYVRNDFSSSLFGDLVKVTDTLYLPKIDNATISRIIFENNTWNVFLKDGKVYVYGDTVSSRQDDPTDQMRIYKWMLSSVSDTNNNTILYTYTKEDGQIYPESISYGNQLDGSFVYVMSFIKDMRTKVSTSFKSAFRVETKKVISQIQTSFKNEILNTYTSTYTQNSENGRVLLSSIQKDILPKTEFEYQKETVKGYTSNQHSTGIVPIDLKNGVTLADINADGYMDLLRGYRWDSLSGPSGVSQFRDVSLYNPKLKKWEKDESIIVPVDVLLYSGHIYNTMPTGTKTLDLNGDLKTDFLQTDPAIFYAQPRKCYLKAEINWQECPRSFDLQMDDWARPMDLNGDGLTDLIKSRPISGQTQWKSEVALNLGASFNRYDPAFVEGQNKPFTNLYDWSENQQLVDVNNDGLPDVLKNTMTTQDIGGGFGRTVYTKSTLLNTGTGWTEDTRFQLPDDLFLFAYGRSGQSIQNLYFVDFNNDGFVDIFQPDSNISRARRNTGTTWVRDAVWDVYASLSTQNCYCQNPGLVGDFTGDGIADFLSSTTNGGTTLTTNIAESKNPLRQDLLSKITLPAGGSYAVQYGSSAQEAYPDGLLKNPKMPFTMHLVKSIISDSGSGSVERSEYEYFGGSYYYKNPTDRKFAGFEKVIESTPEKRVTTYYHQGNGSNSMLGEYGDTPEKIGMVYKTEIASPSGSTLYQASQTKYNQIDSVAGFTFVYTADSIDTLGDVSSAIHFTYDPLTKNLTEKIEYGSVSLASDGSYTDTETDLRKTSYQYATNTERSQYAISKETLTNIQGEKEAEKDYLYDGLAAGLTKGNKTEEKTWVSGNYVVTTSTTYGDFGLPIHTRDENGNQTSYEYDPYLLYLTKIHVPLGMETEMRDYDYRIGKPRIVIDPNGTSLRTAYDGRGRITAEFGPDDLGNEIEKKRYVYTDTRGSVSARASEYIAPTAVKTTDTYFDGFGRPVQTSTSNGVAFATVHTVYNPDGTTQKTSLPYTTPTNTRISPPNISALYTSYVYDSLDRALSETTALGTTSHSYTGYTDTITDARGVQKIYTKDAFGNLIAVQEKNQGEVYTTRYEYDTRGSLLRITDALGNIRNFSYDGRGLRTFASDLHAPSDTTFSVYAYQYDAKGNLFSKTMPDGTRVRYVYNALGQLESEDASNTGVLDISYIYNSCTYGKGRLCSAIRRTDSGMAVAIMAPRSVYDPATEPLGGGSEPVFTKVRCSKKSACLDTLITSSYVYTPNGQVRKESLVDGSQVFHTTYRYTHHGAVDTTLHPDGSIVRYSYGSHGMPTSISYQKAGAQNAEALVSSVEYHPSGAVEKIVRPNGITTRYSYDPEKAYQLRSIETRKNQNLLDSLIYTYDALGNILTKDQNGVLVTYQYDDLSRLTSAISDTESHAYKYNALGSPTLFDRILYQYASTDHANPHAPTTINTTPLQYNKNGNLTSDTTKNLAWNYRNELTTLSEARSNYSYTYNHSGSRIKTIAPTGTTYTPTKSFTKTPTDTTLSITLGDMQVAEITNTIPTYLLTDHLGSTTKTVAQDGTILTELSYTPYGSQTTIGTLPNRTYIGERSDDTGLNYLNARYYNSAQGYFMSVDPVFWEFDQVWLADPQNQNSYSYARGNPVNLSDPSGKSAISNIFQSIKNNWNSVFGSISSGQSTYNSQIVTQPQKQQTKTPEVKTTTWDSVSDARIKQLDPRLQQPATNFINNTESELSTQLRVTQGYRSISEQNKLYNQSRSTPPTGPWATNAKGGQSYHNYGLAIDVVIMENGKPNWAKPVNQDIANIGIKQGFEWGGNWTPKSRDYPHFEMTFGQSWQSLLKASK